MKNDTKLPAPRVSAYIRQGIDALHLTSSEFIRKFWKDHGERSAAKNHLFRVIKGGSIPGEKDMLPMICTTLGLDFDKARQLAIQDKVARNEWRPNVLKFSDKAQELVTVFESLDKRDQNDILQLAKLKARLF